jgi:hypothetical protein
MFHVRRRKGLKSESLENVGEKNEETEKGEYKRMGKVRY